MVVWDDHRIKPGSRWKREIQDALDKASVAILMLSPDYLSSQFIGEVELPQLALSAREGGTQLCLVHARRSVATAFPTLRSIQAINPPESPAVEMTDIERERLWSQVGSLIVCRNNGNTGLDRRAQSRCARITEHLLRFVLHARTLATYLDVAGLNVQSGSMGAQALAEASQRYQETHSALFTASAYYTASMRDLLPSELHEQLEDVIAFALEDVHRQVLEPEYVAMLFSGSKLTYRSVNVNNPPRLQVFNVAAVLSKVELLERRVRRLSRRISAC